MADGVIVAGRHDGAFWRAADAARSVVAGTTARAIYCLCWIKGDWAEYAVTVGFPAWNSVQRCCFACNCCLRDMYKLLGAGPSNPPHRPNREDDYFTACERCELEVEIVDETKHAAVCSLLY